MAAQLTVEELERAGERELGTSSWFAIEQRNIDQFAEATGDHQWIHVDPEAAAQGPFGTTVAHGYLTLSLIPALLSEVFSITDAKMGVNYGVERARFTSPVRKSTSSISNRVSSERGSRSSTLASSCAARALSPACIASMPASSSGSSINGARRSASRAACAVGALTSPRPPASSAWTRPETTRG
jgi:hypothetical protein